MYSIHLKRIYETKEKSDGYRILVDRLWPRGIKKEDAAIDEWAKGITPSPELRKHYHKDRSRFEEFTYSYIEELEDSEEVTEWLHHLRSILHERPVTFLYASKNTTQNHALVLKKWVDSKINTM